jgi:glycosyltransferase involved in cell wall biosynthesis
MPNSQSILVDAPFTGGINGHGGDHRTAQLMELLQAAEMQPVVLEKPLLTDRMSRVLAGFFAIMRPSTMLFILKHRLKIPYTPTAIAFCGFQRRAFSQAMNRHDGAKVLLWESIKYYIAPYVAQENEFSTIAVPHNLDCLLLGSTEHRELATEIAALAKADAVFCISREEQWLLKLKGVNADYLPYYPPEMLVDQLLQVRQLRAETTQERFLILGSAGNEPTFLGMVEQLDWLQKGQTTVKIDVVGYETERLKEYVTCENITIHGGVSAEQLNHFLIHASAALVHQQSGIGALTRIPELLIAGVPIIANSTACRSAFNYAGVYCYDDSTELAELMAKPLSMPPILPRPVSAERRFIESIRHRQ